MMETAKDFEDVRVGLCNGIEREILNLKHFMEAIDEDKFSDDSQAVAEIVERIFYANEGLNKLANVLSFIDCWEENGEPPQLSQQASFAEKSELKEWQKDVMLREGTLN